MLQNFVSEKNRSISEDFISAKKMSESVFSLAQNFEILLQKETKTWERIMGKNSGTL